MKEPSFPYKKIMIFGRPGSGKTTFSHWLSQKTSLSLYHLDKYFFTDNWEERKYIEFLEIQQNFVKQNSWIIDGNSTRSFEMRWSQADLLIYFNYPKCLCLYRILKRYFCPNTIFDDRPNNCPERISIKLLTYMWNFEKRIDNTISILKERYPDAVFKEIKDDRELEQFKNK